MKKLTIQNKELRIDLTDEDCGTIKKDGVLDWTFRTKDGEAIDIKLFHSDRLRNEETGDIDIDPFTLDL